jgi:hypothetical protein
MFGKKYLNHLATLCGTAEGFACIYIHTQQQNFKHGGTFGGPGIEIGEIGVYSDFYGSGSTKEDQNC